MKTGEINTNSNQNEIKPLNILHAVFPPPPQVKWYDIILILPWTQSYLTPPSASSLSCSESKLFLNHPYKCLLDCQQKPIAQLLWDFKTHSTKQSILSMYS